MLLDSAQFYQRNDPDKSLQKINEALALARKTRYHHGENLAFIALGEYHFILGNYAKAVEQATKILAKATDEADTLAMALAHRLLGWVNTLGIKQYNTALAHQLKAREYFIKLNDSRNISANCGNLSWIYAITGDNLAEAHRLANEGIRLADSLKDYLLLSYNHNSKGLIYKAQNNYDSALYHFGISNQAAQQANEKAVFAYNKQLMGETALKAGWHKQALTWFTEAATVASTLKLREVIKESHKGLAEAYAALDNPAKAYFHLTRYNMLKDSLLNVEIAQRALLANHQLENERQLKQIATLKLEAQRAQREQLIFSIAFAIVLVLMGTILILSLRNNYYRKQANRELQRKNMLIEEQNQKLAQAAALRDKLFSVISHDLRSPLVSLSGLLSMLQKGQITEVEFRMMTPKVNQLLLGTSETLENLLKWGHTQLGLLTFLPVSIDMHELVNLVFRLYIEIAAHKKIELVNQTDPQLYITADRNVAELILRNLIHNAIKFSNPGGTVFVCSGQNNDECYFEVRDKGAGIPENLMQQLATANPVNKPGTLGEKGTGLGLRLCAELLERHGGRLECANHPEGGAAFRVWFKTATTPETAG
ncbi:MAG: hypothetical protein KatS3mg032_0140 [Cyclobacteriaceae bacterium]|nr:MAG: hypothetical protein KatS3mg032_0140 [Cyclobacteriaceae bacterium]